MAERNFRFISMVLALFIVTFVSAAILGTVHSFTKEKIELAKKKARVRAIKDILPEFQVLDEAVEVKLTYGESVFTCYRGRDPEKKSVGVAVMSYSDRGYSGRIEVMFGFRMDGHINGYAVLEHKETPGLGSKMQKWFSDTGRPGRNIVGKSPGKGELAVSKDGGDVDAITSATITSRAFLEAANRAFEAFEKVNGTVNEAVR